MASWQVWKHRVGTALFLGAVSVHALAADPVLSVVATPGPVVAGSTLGLDVVITGVADLFAYQYSLAFNPAVLQVAGVTEGTFLSAAGSTFFGGGTVNNVLGSISFTYDTLLGASAGVSGTGVLTHIDLNVIQGGSSALTFSDVLVANSASAAMSVQVVNGLVQAVPEPAVYLLFSLGLAGIAATRLRASQQRSVANR